MRRSVSFRYALRSLTRSPRRTILSVAGAGIGCALGMISTAWIGGETEMIIRAASESGAGHLKIVPAGWVERRENASRLADWSGAVKGARAIPGVRSVTSRAKANGLLAMGNRVAGLAVVGVEPETEPASNRIVNRAEIEGRYLEAGDRGVVVIGSTVARKLGVELDDDLHVTLSGRGEMKAAMLRIVGILRTGSRDLDGGICHVILADLARITGYGGAGEVSILLDDHRRISSGRDELRKRIRAGDEVITWEEVSPEMAANLKGDTVFTAILISIIVIVVSLGITSAGLTSVLERRREFGVLSALGMKGRQIAGLLLVEAVLTGLAGAVVALAIGAPVAWLLAAKGVDFAAMMGGDVGMAGILFDPVMHAAFGPWVVGFALAVCVVSTVGSIIYPAWFALKTDPAAAIRVV